MPDDPPDDRWEAQQEAKDYDSEIAELRSELRAIPGMIAAAKAEVLASIVLQVGGSGITISGGNGKFTITGTGPTGGTVTGTFDCDSDPPIFNGTLTLT